MSLLIVVAKMMNVVVNADTKRNVWQGKNIAFNSLLYAT